MTSTLESPAVEESAPNPAYAYAPAPPDRLTALVNRVAERTPRWVGPAAAAAGVVGALAFTLLVRPTEHDASTTPDCLLKLFTGFDCPGCGGTRAAWYLMHGDVPAAARHHAPFVFTVPFLSYLYVVWNIRTLTRWRPPQLRVPTRALLIFLGVWLLFSVLRNLPFEPFSWLYV